MFTTAAVYWPGAGNSRIGRDSSLREATGFALNWAWVPNKAGRGILNQPAAGWFQNMSETLDWMILGIRRGLQNAEDSGYAVWQTCGSGCFNPAKPL